ncbi:HNH endonuclease [Agrobacterium vitis]|nr:HNH endonuclease [Agrobacterium vitis]
MAKIKTLSSSLRMVDTRSVKPPPKQADKELASPEYRAWAAEVKRRAGYQCEWVEAGKRCHVGAPARLFADHIVERRDGGALLDINNGQCLCGSHHTRKTAAARADRMRR